MEKANEIPILKKEVLFGRTGELNTIKLVTSDKEVNSGYGAYKENSIRVCSSTILSDYSKIGYLYFYQAKKNKFQYFEFWDALVEEFPIFSLNIGGNEVEKEELKLNLDLEKILTVNKDIASHCLALDESNYGIYGMSLVECLSNIPEIKKHPLKKNKVGLVAWAYLRQKAIKARNLNEENTDILSAFIEQQELVKHISVSDDLSKDIRFVAFVNKSFELSTAKIYIKVTVKDILEGVIIEEEQLEAQIKLPFLSDFYSSKEAAPILKVFKKLKSKIDLIIFKGNGINHPIRIGTGTYIGIKLNLPLIACSKRRIIGIFEEKNLSKEKNAEALIKIGEESVMTAVRLYEDVAPVFISPGHRVNMKSAVKWSVKLKDEISEFFTDKYFSFDLMGDYELESLQREIRK